jgi:hypothetical protein
MRYDLINPPEMSAQDRGSANSRRVDGPASNRRENGDRSVIKNGTVWKLGSSISEAVTFLVSLRIAVLANEGEKIGVNKGQCDNVFLSMQVSNCAPDY